MRALALSSLAGLVAGLIVAGCNSDMLEQLDTACVVPAPTTFSMQIHDYQPASGHAFRNIFVSNFSIKVHNCELEYSTARDGMSDAWKKQFENDYGFVPALPDSNSDGFSDLLMLQGGITYGNQVSLFCGANQRDSSSNDAFVYNDQRLGGLTAFLGLRDCEKSFLQLQPSKFDFDGDGIPDYLEIRAGLNPRNPNDAFLNMANDDWPNIEKVRHNFPIDLDTKSQPNLASTYQYTTDFDATGVRTFNIKNIPILNNGVDNFIAIYVTESDTLTHQDSLYTAFMILNHSPDPVQPIRIKYWGNDPSLQQNNQELQQP